MNLCDISTSWIILEKVARRRKWKILVEKVVLELGEVSTVIESYLLN